MNANRLLAAMVLIVGGLIAATAIFEHRHPCLRYSTHRVFVPEFTTFTDINGGPLNGGVSIPVTWPAHYEDEMVCEERK